MLIYPDDRVLIAVMNNKADWHRALNERWYRIPVKYAPEVVPNIDILAFYFTRAFGDDKWAVHYYARVQGHELLTRRDLIPSEPDHPRAGAWYYRLALGKVEHKIPPLVAGRWKRITFIVTTGDRFEAAQSISDLFDNAAPQSGQFVTLKEAQLSQW